MVRPLPWYLCVDICKNGSQINVDIKDKLTLDFYLGFGVYLDPLKFTYQISAVRRLIWNDNHNARHVKILIKIYICPWLSYFHVFMLCLRNCVTIRELTYDCACNILRPKLHDRHFADDISNAFSEGKPLEFEIRCTLNMFLVVQLIKKIKIGSGNGLS